MNLSVSIEPEIKALQEISKDPFLFSCISSLRNETGTILDGKVSPLKVCKRRKLGGRLDI